jgi:hypothetical protein
MRACARLDPTKTTAWLSLTLGLSCGCQDPALAQPHFFKVFVDGAWQPGPPDDGGGASQHTFGTGGWGNGSSVAVTLAAGLDPDASHFVEVFKSTEAQWNEITVSPNYMALLSVELAGGESTTTASAATPALLRQRQPTLPPPPPQQQQQQQQQKHPLRQQHPLQQQPRRIEFLGDSITAGYCNLCELQGGAVEGAEAEGAFEAWPQLAASSLSAESHVVAWSGYGLVHNCCGGHTHMPAVYRRALGSVPDNDAGAATFGGEPFSNAWSFGWAPDAVVINLGTNDVGSGSYDEERHHKRRGMPGANLKQRAKSKLQL